MMNGIIWLASYPKSGNTWFRIFLRNLLSPSEQPARLDAIGFPIASGRAIFDDFAGIDSSDLTPDEIDSLRPRVYEQIAAEAREGPVFMKTHDAYTYLPNGEPLLSRGATAGAIYLIRNPLDVAVSFANHSAHQRFDYTVARMGSRTDAFNATTDRLDGQLRQQLLGWSGHVHSWLAARDTALHVMRYEDMKSASLRAFTAAIRFAGLEHSEALVQQALDRCQFEKLQEQERGTGFREKYRKCKAFFRAGETGTWRRHLSEAQVARIIADHGDLMTQFGYLCDDGCPVV